MSNFYLSKIDIKYLTFQFESDLDEYPDVDPAKPNSEKSEALQEDVSRPMPK